MSDCVTSRLSKLREMRETLCKKEKTWKEAFAMRDWIVEQLSILHEMTTQDDVTKSDIKDRLDDLLCALDPGDKDER
tara:strand:+ start:434 stop:664 length:231 start_codon:yes stop_codon:yes gene_type:complete